MRIKISKGNSKLGDVNNLSLPPILTCDKNPCTNSGCYALKFYKMYTNVKQSWDSNLSFYKEDSSLFFKELDDFLKKTKKSLFRFHVGGDIPDQNYFNNMIDICNNNDHIYFLVYTKKINLDFSLEIPNNLNIIISSWDDVFYNKIPNNLKDKFTLSHVKDLISYESSLTDTFECSGNCVNCGYTCWDTKDLGIKNIVFKKH